MIFNDKKETKNEFDFVIEDESYLPEGLESQDYFFGEEKAKDTTEKKEEKLNMEFKEKNVQDDFDKTFNQQNVTSDEEKTEPKKTEQETISGKETISNDKDSIEAEFKNENLGLGKLEEKPKNKNIEIKQQESSTKEKKIITEEDKQKKSLSKDKESTNGFDNIDLGDREKNISMEEFLNNGSMAKTEEKSAIKKLNNVEEKTDEKVGEISNNKKSLSSEESLNAPIKTEEEIKSEEEIKTDVAEKKRKNNGVSSSTSKSTMDNITKKVSAINKEEAKETGDLKSSAKATVKETKVTEETKLPQKTMESKESGEIKEEKQQKTDLDIQKSEDEDFSDFSNEEDENFDFNNVDYYDEGENGYDKKDKTESEKSETEKKGKGEIKEEDFKFEPLLDDKVETLEDEEEILKEIENINLKAMHEGESIDEKEKEADQLKGGVMKSKSTDKTIQKDTHKDVDLISKYKKEKDEEEEDEDLKKKMENISHASKSEKETFISNEVAKMAQDSIAKLKKANENDKESDISHMTLESLVRSSLEKKLSSWLDKNLAKMVEEIVQKEIDTIVSKEEEEEEGKEGEKEEKKEE